MNANVGRLDRIIRALIGFGLILAPLLNVPQIWSSGAIAIASMVIGAVLVLTALVRFCPLYRLVGLSSCKL